MTEHNHILQTVEVNDHVTIEWDKEDNYYQVYVIVSFGDSVLQYYVVGKDRRRIGAWTVIDLETHLGDHENPTWIRDEENVELPVRKLPALKGWLEEARDKLQ